MSELIAEARVLVTPDTTAFRTQLVAQTTAAAKGVVVPVQVTPVITGTSGTAALAAQEAQIASSTARSTAEIAGATAVKNQAIKTNAAYARSLGGVSSGAASAGLSLVGLRGATLAASGPFLAGAAGAIALGNALRLATSFNSEIAVLGATTDATGAQLETAAAAAREFGRDITLPGVTAGDAAKTITEFSKAGLDLNESIAATRGGLQLAQAAQLSYTDAVTLTANALNAFGLSGNQAVRVADTLANASNLAQGGIEDTALALRQAASAAEIVGVSFEDTTALLTLLAKNGLTGSDAGTALRTAFLRLVNPSEEANAIIKSLGVNLRDAAGNVRPEVFAEFAEAQRNLSVATQQANAAIVFGQDAFRAFGVLASEGTEGLTEVQIALRKTGTAAEIARARMVGLAGAQENLSNQLSALGETIGQLATPPLTFFVDELARYVGVTGQVVTETKKVADAFAELTQDLPGSGGGLDFGQAFRDAFAGVRDLNPQAKAIFDFIDILRGGEEEAEEEVKNGGVALRDALETAGREAARGAASYEDRITGAIDDAFGAIRARLAAASQAFRSAQIAAVGRGQGQAAGLDEALNRIVAGGGSEQQQIANLQKQARVQADIIRAAGPAAAGVQLEARREAQARLAQINTQIIAIEKGIAAERKSATDEALRIAEDSQREADQAFLERQEDTRGRQERLVGLAGETESLRDDIKRRQDLRKLITQQITALRQSSVDEKTKQAAIKVLVAAKQATSDAINSLVRTQAQQNQEQREAAQEERESAQIALGESILDLTGNKNPLLRALDAAIKDAQAEKRKAKQGSVEAIEAQTEINNLLKRRRDVIEETKRAADADRGMSAFQILQENVDTFRSTAGNLINGQQPFTGPAGFSADVAQFLHRPSTRVEMVQKPSTSSENLQRQVNEQLVRLIAALEANTAARGGNASTVNQGDILGARANAQAAFYLSRQARQLTEAESP